MRKAIISNDIGGISNFLHEIGDVLFSRKVEKDASGMKKWVYEKAHGLNRAYCNVIDSIKVQDGTEKIIEESKNKCDESRVTDSKTNYNMMMPRSMKYSKYKPAIESDKETIEFVINSLKTEERQSCVNKSYNVKVNKNCLGFDKIYKLSLKYPWLEK